MFGGNAADTDILLRAPNAFGLCRAASAVGILYPARIRADAPLCRASAPPCFRAGAGGSRTDCAGVTVSFGTRRSDMRLVAALQSVGWIMSAVSDRPRAPVLRSEPRAQLPERAQREALLSHARALIAAKPIAPAPAMPIAPKVQSVVPPVLPTGQRVRLQMFCSGAGVAFIGIGLERNGVVQLVGHELPGPGNGGGALPARSYTFAGAVREWNCPVCRAAPAGIEAFCCDCACFSDVLHCGGYAGHMVYCACGDLGEANFRLVPSLSVRGHATARVPAMRLMSRPLPPPALLPRCLR